MIRTATPSDAAACCAIYNPVIRDTAISFEAEPVSEDAMARRIESTLPRHPWLVLESGGAVSGYAYGWRIDPRLNDQSIGS